MNVLVQVIGMVDGGADLTFGYSSGILARGRVRHFQLKRLSSAVSMTLGRGYFSFEEEWGRVRIAMIIAW